MTRHDALVENPILDFLAEHVDPDSQKQRSAGYADSPVALRVAAGVRPSNTRFTADGSPKLTDPRLPP